SFRDGDAWPLVHVTVVKILDVACQCGMLPEGFDPSPGARIGDIRAEVGCGELAVRAALARARLPLRGVPLRYPQLRDRSWLRGRYVEHRVSVRDIAGELGCDASAVYEALDAAAIARIRPRGG